MIHRSRIFALLAALAFISVVAADFIRGFL
jgi:hypothetical protein